MYLKQSLNYVWKCKLKSIFTCVKSLNSEELYYFRCIVFLSEIQHFF